MSSTHAEPEHESEVEPRLSRSRKVEARLRALIRRQESVLVALSGGVDSTVIAALAQAELGSRAVAATGDSASLSSTELSSIRAFCEARHLRHIVVATHELEQADYVANGPDRCFHCKNELYGTLAKIASSEGVARVLDGTHADDLGTHRPGHAAATHHRVLSPLVEVGATKHDVRQIAARLGLDNAERPSSPCLSSRIAYGLQVSPERLEQIAAAEAFLRTLGIPDLRVRHHDAIARIEVPAASLAQVVEQAAAIQSHIRSLGFTYVTLDLGGLRSGSLLEVLGQA